MKQRKSGGILSPEVRCPVRYFESGPSAEQRLRVSIWGAGDEQNHYDRILAAVVQQWGYEVWLQSATLMNGGCRKEGEKGVEVDVLLCDLDVLARSPALTTIFSASVSQHETSSNEQRGMLSAISLARVVIALSSRSVSRSTLEELGAVALLYKPFEMSLLQRYLEVMEHLLLDKPPVQAAPTPASGEASQRILVVDDHAEVAETIKQCLECDSRYDVRVARDGLEALEQCTRWLPDCIVTDLLMPWMNGYQVMRSLSAGKLRFSPAFVVLSALPQGDLPLHRDYLKGREVVFVEKPFQVDQLLQAVEQALPNNRIKEGIKS